MSQKRFVSTLVDLARRLDPQVHEAQTWAKAEAAQEDQWQTRTSCVNRENPRNENIGNRPLQGWLLDSTAFKSAFAACFRRASQHRLRDRAMKVLLKFVVDVSNRSRA